MSGRAVIFSFLSKSVLAGAALALACISAHAEEALAAVASNFAEPAAAVETAFEASSPHELTIAAGSTGKLYAQITKGAPFDVFLAADADRPKRLEANGHAVPGSRFTYAVGRLTLWSPEPALFGADGEGFLADSPAGGIAIANPEIAPYGAAALETLKALGLQDALSSQIVLGENIAHAFAMTATGNAQAGFVALSYVLSPRNENPGSRWDPPAGLYTPIRQDAVLLQRGKDNAAATAFMAFLKSDEAHTVIESFGYGAVQ